MQELYLAIEKSLHSLGYSFEKPKALSEAILKASTYFIERSGVSPWSQKDFCAAYMAHFLPMNVFRIEQGLKRLTEATSPHHLYMTERLKTAPIYDYGAGPLTWLIAYRLHFQAWPKSYTYYDLSAEAPKLGLSVLKHLGEVPNIEAQEFSQVPENTLACLSYSLNELSEEMKLQFLKFNDLLVIEPSMRTTSRQLLEFRKSALEQSFKSLAPCVHSLPCPMLSFSEKDWCFDRVHIDIPAFASELYKLLPFDQDQATFSYLFLTQTEQMNIGSQTQSALDTVVEAAPAALARIVGDTQKEKGKTRTMVCRNEEREFFSILKKQKLDLKLRRGDILNLPSQIETKGNEIRITALPES